MSQESHKFEPQRAKIPKSPGGSLDLGRHELACQTKSQLGNADEHDIDSRRDTDVDPESCVHVR
jgi:hypothetical protein